MRLFAGGWPALFEFLGNCVAAENAALRSSALLVFGNLAHSSSAVLEAHSANLLAIYGRALADPQLSVCFIVVCCIT